MPLLDQNGKNPIRGNDYDWTVTISDWPIGVTATKVWVTFKAGLRDSDADAVLQKVITSGTTSDGNQLIVPVTLTAANTNLFTAGTKYYFGVKTLDSNGKINTPLRQDTVTFDRDLTEAVA